MKLTIAALATFLGAANVFAAAPKYECYPTDTNMDKETLVVTPRTVSLSGHKLTLDPTYRPRLNKDYLRFDGDTSFLTAESYAIDVLVHKNAKNGPAKTSMKILARGEGFFNTFYNCFRRN